MGGLHGVVDVVDAGERHRPLDLAGGRVHVLVHAAPAAAAPLIADVQVHVGHGSIEGAHGSPSWFQVKSYSLWNKLLDFATSHVVLSTPCPLQSCST